MKKTILLLAAIVCLTLTPILVNATTPAAPNSVNQNRGGTLPGNTPAPGTNQRMRTTPKTNQNNNMQMRTTPRTNQNNNTNMRTTPGTNQFNNTQMRTVPGTNATDNINRGIPITLMENPAVRLSMNGATGAIKINDSNSYKQIDISCDIDNAVMTNAQLIIDIPKNLILGSYSNGEDIASIQNTTNIIQPDGSRTLTFNFLPNTNGTQRLDFLVMLPNGAFGTTTEYTITATLSQAGNTTHQITDTLRLIPSYDSDLK